MAGAVDLQTLESAVICAYDPTSIEAVAHAEREQVKRNATAYCDQVRQSPQGWHSALLLFRGSDNVHAKFFALSSLQEFLGGRQVASSGIRLDEAARVQLRDEILQWIAEHRTSLGSEETFIRTKLAIVLVLLLKTDYPERWQTPFGEMMQFLEHEPAMIELFLRVLVAIDEEIVMFHVDRQADEVAHNSLIKDTMRNTTCVADICAAIYHIVETYEVQLPELALFALTTFTKYIGWIDVAHVVNERSLSIIYRCLKRPPLCEGALDCLLEIVNKGMEEAPKLRLLVDLQLCSLLEGVPLCEDEDVAMSGAQVLAAAGTQLLEMWDNLEPLVVQDSDAARSHCPSAVAAAEVLNNMMPLAWAFMSHRDIDVAGAAVPLVMRVLETLKRQLDEAKAAASGQGAIPAIYSVVAAPFVAMEHMPSILTVVYQQLHYSDGFQFEDSDEEEAEEEIHRRNVRKIFLKSIRVCPEMTLEFVCTMLSGLQPPLSSVPFPRIEAALRLVYHFGEGLGPKNQQLANEGHFPELLSALHRSGVSAHPHWSVRVIYFELTVRYVRHFRTEPKLIGPVLESMCGPNGLTNAHPTLRARSCFLLKSFVKSLGSSMSPYTATILHGVRELLFAGTATSLSESDLGHLFEIAAHLVNNSGLTIDDQLTQLESLVMPIISAMQELIHSPGLQNGDADRVGDQLAQKISFLAQLSKGTNKSLVQLWPVYTSMVQASTSALVTLPTHTSLRSKFMVIIHRMVLCLDTGLLEFLPHSLPLLIAHMASSEVDNEAQRDSEAMVQLVNQLIIKYEERLYPVLEPHLMQLLQRFIELMPKPPVGGGSPVPPHIGAVVLGLQRHYFLVVQHVVAHKLAHILLSPQQRPHLEQVLNTVLSGIVEIDDPVSKKTCLSVMVYLVKAWVPDGPKAGLDANAHGAFVAFLMEKVVPGALGGVLAPGFRVKDAGSLRVVVEISTLLHALSTTLGPPFVQALVGEVLPALEFPADLGQQLGVSLSGPPLSEVQKVLRSCIQQVHAR